MRCVYSLALRSSQRDDLAADQSTLKTRIITYICCLCMDDESHARSISSHRAFHSALYATADALFDRFPPLHIHCARAFSRILHSVAALRVRCTHAIHTKCRANKLRKPQHTHSHHERIFGVACLVHTFGHITDTADTHSYILCINKHA